ncbi:Cytochrome P450 [Penicillium cf. griseofulvum]|uniref:Cytochrome P450 n=1 Tax=Penicillium cf. griseofulvum TaxID=2972120 RepID=A0A9W9MQ59_9EURO|nr:Cytochrome P450 [Penicillium cf. griseofulvum]KAJ5441674.1 Cytochrome P450 [Penicillium cf. griseofulvum]
MASLSFDLFQTPFYGLVVGAVLITWSLAKSVQDFQRWKYARQNGCQPFARSVCHGLFGLGMVMELAKAGPEHRFLELVRGWHQGYGPTFKARVANRNLIFTADPKNLQTILALKFKDFSVGTARLDALRPALGNGIFGVDGAAWEHSRALLRPNFLRAQINDTELYETHVVDLIAQIPRDGSTIDLQPLFFKGTLDTATDFLLGESSHTLRKEGSSAGAVFAKAFDIVQDVTSMRFRVGRFAMFYRRKEFLRAVRDTRGYIDRFVQKTIDYRLAVNSGWEVDQDVKRLTDSRYIFSHELSKQTLDKTNMTDQILSIIFAGRDTTASLLGIVFFYLARRPDVWDRLRNEIIALDGEKPSFEVLKSMTYLTWVLNETLRLYPIAPFNVREAIKDTFLPVGGGPDGKSPVLIPKGHEVVFSVYTMHRENEIYAPDADEFRPERWENLRPSWAYLPFNGGPRICIGQQFALTEAGYTIVRIMQQFGAIENRDPNPWTENLGLTLSSANGTKVALTPV